VFLPMQQHHVRRAKVLVRLPNVPDKNWKHLSVADVRPESASQILSLRAARCTPPCGGAFFPRAAARHACWENVRPKLAHGVSYRPRSLLTRAFEKVVAQDRGLGAERSQATGATGM